MLQTLALIRIVVNQSGIRQARRDSHDPLPICRALLITANGPSSTTHLISRCHREPLAMVYHAFPMQPPIPPPTTTNAHTIRVTVVCCGMDLLGSTVMTSKPPSCLHPFPHKFHSNATLLNHFISMKLNIILLSTTTYNSINPSNNFQFQNK
jgi:hypothetical protein